MASESVAHIMSEKRNRAGRPPKFEEARRPITVTLPERVLEQLAAIHPDRARAIVKAAKAATSPQAGDTPPPIEVVEASPGQAVIIIGPSRALREIEWLRLVEVAPGRFLLAVPTGTATESLEVAVEDLIEHLAEDEQWERQLLTELHRVLRHRRQQREFSKMEILLIRTGSR